MILFGNLIIPLGETIVMLNLFSFRRKYISSKVLDIIINANIKVENKLKLSDSESNLILNLTNEKQILSENEIDVYEFHLRKEWKSGFLQYYIKNVHFCISHNCNFKCTYCFENKSSNNSYNLELSEINNCRNLIEKSNGSPIEAYSIDVTISGGEPLISDNISMVNHIMNVFSKQKISLFTNGFYILDCIDRIEFRKFNMIQVSLDGENEVINQLSFQGKLNRNEDVFSKILGGIKYLLNLDINVSIVSILTPYTISNIHNFLETLDNENVLTHPKCKIVFSLVINPSDSTKLDWNFYSLDQFKFIIDEFYRTKLTYPMINIVNLPDFSVVDNLIFRKNNERVYPRISRCTNNGEIGVTVEPNGDILCCSSINPGGAIIGNLKTNEISNTKIFNFYNRDIFSIGTCMKCIYRYICSGGCPLTNISTGSNIQNPVCGIFGDEKMMDLLVYSLRRKYDYFKEYHSCEIK